jgi:type III secretion protein O
MYDDLLRIKAFREQDAAHAVTRQRRIVEECAKAMERARAKVVEFRVYRVNKEQQLFDEIKGRPVAMRAIEMMKQRVAELRGQEAELENQILAAEKQLRDAQQSLEEARRQHAKKVREHEKFNKFIEVQRTAERLEHVRREENELEEIASAAHQVKPMAQ